jgi:beta-glucosidase
MNMNSKRRLTCLFLALLFVLALAGVGEAAQPPYRDASRPIAQRIEDLLGQMTLEEKVGQMNMPCVYEAGLGETMAAKTEAVQKFAAGTYVKGLGPGGGFFTLPNTILHEGPQQQAEFLNKLQRIALEQTRLGIPLLETEEGTHGLMCPGGTIFPEGPAIRPGRCAGLALAQ